MSKMKLLCVLMVTAAVVMAWQPGPTLAADKGFYLEGHAGASFAEDAQSDTATNQDTELDTGFVVGAGLGYAYGNGLRGEIGFDYRENDADNVGGTAASGDASVASIMVNGYYDFFQDKKFQPYIGGGFGVAFVDTEISPFVGSSVDDDDTDFAFQGMAGIAYSVSPQFKVTLGYRYFAVPDLAFTTAAGTSVDADYATHEVMLGVRFSFGAAKPMAEPAPQPAAAPAPPAAKPAPPPPKPAAAPKPEPAPPVARNFLVFFDWDKSVLTSLAQGIVRSAADEAKRVGKARIRLTGHADRSGPRRYNQRLSLRRASAVRRELQRLGIAGNEIAVFAKGETEPLVPTADGVREPQNRRVEIILE